MPDIDVIIPDWPVAGRVRAAVTTRLGGVSGGPFAALNLGDHVGDDAAAVLDNRRRLGAALGLPSEPLWLEQVHGTTVATFGQGLRPQADAAMASEPGQVCAVLTADCLPVLFAHRDGDAVGIAHAGWRGLAAGVIERTIEALAVEPGSLVAWLGPAIGPDAFEVGGEVRDSFVTVDPAATGHFRRNDRGRWLADIYALAQHRLTAAGVTDIHGGGLCTVSDAARFFSYRRDGITGRMAALIWLA